MDLTPRSSRLPVSKFILVVTFVLIMVLGGVAIYAVTSLGPIAQTSSISTGSSTKTSTTALGGSVVIGTFGQLGKTIDPAVAVSPLGINLIRNINDGLVDYLPGTNQVVPALAVNWTSSGGGSVWTFNLRHNVVFPDGAPFNATVQADSVSRSMDKNLGSFASHGLHSLIRSVNVTGPYQIQFALNHPSPVTFVTDTSLYPTDPKTVASDDIINYTGNITTENPNGLGPYVIADWVKTNGNDVSVVLVANHAYWNETTSAPKARNITLLFYSDRTKLLSDLSSGQLDMAYVDAAFGGLQSRDIQGFLGNTSYEVWKGPQALEGSTTAVSTREIGGVVLDSTNIFRYYLITSK